MKTHLLNDKLKYFCGGKGGEATQNGNEVNCNRCLISLQQRTKSINYRIPVETLESMNRKIKKGSHSKFVNLAIMEKLARMTEGLFDVEALKPEPSTFKVQKLGSHDGKKGNFTPFMVSTKDLSLLYEDVYTPTQLHQSNQRTFQENQS